MQRRIVKIALFAAPPTIALLGVIFGNALTTWANDHEGTLLLTLFALVGSLVHPQLRYLVISTLCYGVAFFAARDMFFPFGLPPELRHNYQHVRMVALFIVSILALGAAITESISPGAVWARRCYFAGASLYFFGTGAINYHSFHSWQSIVMISTGVAAFAGSVFAHKIVEMEREDLDATPVVEDLTASKNEAHTIALKAKEWKDPLELADSSGKR